MLDSTHIMVKYFDNEIDIQDEIHKITTNNQIQLQYLPSEDLNISIYLNNNEIDNNKYKIDYDNGIIVFIDTLTNQIVKVDYSAIGEICIDASKVYTNYDNKENILETLDTLIDEQRIIIDQINVIGDVNIIILQMQANIDNLMALYEAVVKNDEILKNIDDRIQECINRKEELVTAIDNVIARGNTTKSQLETAINTGNTTKNELVTTTNTCKSDINKTVTASKSDMTSFTSTKQSELTSTSTTCVNNVNTAITNANNKKNELDRWVTDNGDIVDLNNKVASLEDEKQNKTDDTLNTTAKTIVGAINEINNKSNVVDDIDSVVLASDINKNGRNSLIKDGSGMVVLELAVKYGTGNTNGIANGSVFATLPVGYRPKQKIERSGYVYNTNSDGGAFVCNFRINTNGTICYNVSYPEAIKQAVNMAEISVVYYV